MAAPQNFRSAFNGFNREDVVHYLEYLNTRHQNQLNEMNAEISNLRNLLENSAAAEAGRDEAMEAERDHLRAENETLRAEKEALQAECEAIRAQLAELERNAREQPAEPVNPELDTYRRAQNMERESRTRAELVYFQTSGVLGEASARVEKTAGEITELADQTMRELTRLQVAVSESKHALQDAAAMMKAIRPNS